MYILQKSLEIASSIFPSVYDSTKNRCWHFCFVYRRNKLLTIGMNDMKRENNKSAKMATKYKTNNKYNYRHAEEDAISRLWGRFHIDHKLKFVILRLNKFGDIGHSRPCPHCTTILSALGITEVYWSDRNGTFHKW